VKTLEAAGSSLFLETVKPLPKSDARPDGPLTPKHFVLDQVPEELFVAAGEEELTPHAPVGLTNPFWDA
jgi:hypothetical protein